MTRPHKFTRDYRIKDRPACYVCQGAESDQIHARPIIAMCLYQADGQLIFEKKVKGYLTGMSMSSWAGQMQRALDDEIRRHPTAATARIGGQAFKAVNGQSSAVY